MVVGQPLESLRQISASREWAAVQKASSITGFRRLFWLLCLNSPQLN